MSDKQHVTTSAVDAHGTPITVGCRVRHLYEPCPAGQMPPPGMGHTYHNFSGTSEVMEIRPGHVRVKPMNRDHVPVHVPELLVVAP